MKNTLALMLISLTLSLAACGNSRSDRALSGAGLGAGAGALVGGLTGGGVGTGALVGGALDAAAGGLTKKKDINLGDPVWR